MSRYWDCTVAYVEQNKMDIVWIFAFAVVFYFVLRFVSKGQSRGFSRMMFSLSCSVIFVMTLFGRSQEMDVRPSFFLESYRSAFASQTPDIVLQLVMNIVIYIPLGLFLPFCFPLFERIRYTVLLAFLCSVCIETIQGVFSIGCFEVDDILNNTLGALIGVLLYHFLTRMKERGGTATAGEKKNERC